MTDQLVRTPAYRADVADAIFRHAVLFGAGVAPDDGGLRCVCGESIPVESEAHRQREIRPWMRYYEHVADIVLAIPVAPNRPVDAQ